MNTIRYQFRARKTNGQLVNGELNATDANQASVLLAEQGLIPISVHAPHTINLQVIKAFPQQLMSNLFKRIQPADILMFTQQLETLYSVGVPIVDGLQLIATQTQNAYLRNIVLDIVRQLSDGSTMSDAMARHPRVFDEVYVSVIRVGETSGQLEEALNRLYQVLEAQSENQAKIKSALFYPKMVFGMIIITFLVLVTVVIPRLKTFYASMDAGQLPLPTRIVTGISDFVVGNAIVGVILIAGGIFGFKKWLSTPHGRYQWDQFKLKVPVFGALISDIQMNSFCIILEMLIRSGLGIVQSLDVLKGTLGNKAIQHDVDFCRKRVIAGGKLGDSLKKTKTIPPMISGLVAIGEDAGSLREVLNRCARHYQMQVDSKLSRLSKAIEPFLLAVIFSLVLLLALAIFLPIWKMSSALKR